MIELSTKYLKEHIGARLSAKLGDNYRDVRVGRLREGVSVADAASTFLLQVGRDKFVLRIAPTAFPEVIELEQRRAAAAKKKLGNNLGSVILEPLDQGRLDGRSYAVVPYRTPFSEGGLRWRWEKWQTKPHILVWLEGLVTTGSAGDGRTETFRDFMLLALAELERRVPALQYPAETAKTRILSGAFRPRPVPMHGDFWRGNILRAPRHQAGFPFVVIDWRGSLMDGFAVFDLITLARSYNVSSTRLRAALRRHCHCLECELMDARAYVLGALGYIVMTLDQFPYERFLDLAQLSLAKCDEAVHLW
jgi:hypothetical protein